ncbi:MAG: phosphonate C-P lyase system protein PhnG [Pseudomonadota bacterium]
MWTRAEALAVLAKAPAPALAEALAAALGAAGAPETRDLRSPEIGAVMIRGRAGATGAVFNLGEMTVTRCSLTLPTGEVGHGYVAGRDADHARRVALCDALLQTPMAERIRAQVLAPLAEAAEAARQATAARAATTKVDFFTLVRGEDP